MRGRGRRDIVDWQRGLDDPFGGGGKISDFRSAWHVLWSAHRTEYHLVKPTENEVHRFWEINNKDNKQLRIQHSTSFYFRIL